MPAGFAAYNDSNTILISETYKNHRLVRKGSVTIRESQVGQWYTGPSADVTYTSASGKVPILAILAGSNYLITDYWRISGNTYTWQIRGDSALNNTNITYYIFDIVDDQQSNGGMLQVFGPDGKLVFDSNLEYLRVAAMVNSPNSASPVSLPPGRQYAVANSSTLYRNVITQGPPITNTPPIQYPYEGGVSYVAAPKLVGSSINFGDFSFSYTAFVGPGGRGKRVTSSGSQITIIIDVTGQ